jgi:3-hydroxy-9,10-secoandrosta-1,3,5(10)-triene-9,17-dione monooxygenase reductase component
VIFASSTWQLQALPPALIGSALIPKEIPVQTDTDSALDPRQFRDALGHYASGITVIAGHDGEEPLGFTCQSFYSVSVEPPLVAFSVMTGSTTYPRISETGSFSVNVLAASQRAISNQFARTGTDKWAGVAWSPSGRGNPVIEGSLMWLDCSIWAQHEAGDHLLVLGHVHELCPLAHRGSDPLLYFRGDYCFLR